MWSIWFCREVFGFVVRYFVFAVRFSVLPWGILFLPWGFRFCREVFGFAVTVVGHRITYSGLCPWLQRMRLSIECSPEIFSAVWLTSELYDYPKRRRGEFHKSHAASLHTMLSSFRTHVILSVQQQWNAKASLRNSCLEVVGTRKNGRARRLRVSLARARSLFRPLLNYSVNLLQISHLYIHPYFQAPATQAMRKRKRLVLPLKLSVPLLCRSIYDFRFTIPNISLVKSKRVFWPPIIS